MKAIRFLALPCSALLFASCANKSQDDGYDTGDAYQTPSAPAPHETAAAPTGNPTYDTPAAYEENTSSSAPAPDSAIVDPAAAGTPKRQPTAPTHPAAPSLPAAKTPGGGTVHVVVKGDTLGGIARKYNTTIAAIKQANSMTSDVVVLGKKLIIPAASR